ncbi:MAG TPA: SCO family protein [Candidatus Eremiobacteraceae bacterium]|nr:SCO family protein [Candidatus Eremiobacteraceae bacterium]
MIAILMAAFTINGSAQAQAAAPPTSAPLIPNVTLIDERGVLTPLAALKGRVVLISFFSSTDSAQGTCTAVAGKFLYLQRHLPASGYRLLEITRDPERDSPQRLSAYAKLFASDPRLWSFLTGDRRQIDLLAKTLGASRRRKLEQDEPLFVIDATGHVAGVLKTSDWSPEDALALATHVRAQK